MPSVAEQLRDARAKQELSIAQIEEITKIKADHVRALEDGNYNVFAAPIYIRGFVRSFASAVKLDVAAILQELDAELARTKEFHEPPSLTGTRDGALDYLMLQLSKVNWRVGLWLLGGLLGFLIFFSAYRAWSHYMNSDPLADLGPGLYQPQRAGPGDILPLPRR